MTTARARRVGLPHILDAVTALDGLLLFSTVDPHTGMALMTHVTDPAMTGCEGSAAAGAADVVRSLAVMGALVSPAAELVDVVVTLTDHHYLLRTVRTEDGRDVVVAVVLGRADGNVAMALRVLRRLPEMLPEMGPPAGALAEATQP